MTNNWNKKVNYKILSYAFGFLGYLFNKYPMQGIMLYPEFFFKY